MREGLSHSFRADWQMRKACTGGGKDRVSNRMRDRCRCSLREANGHFRAWEKLDLNFGYVAHPEQRAGVEIRILRLAFHELRSLAQSHAPPSTWAMALSGGHNRASVNDKGRLLYCDAAAP